MEARYEGPAMSGEAESLVVAGSCAQQEWARSPLVGVSLVGWEGGAGETAVGFGIQRRARMTRDECPGEANLAGHLPCDLAGNPWRAVIDRLPRLPRHLTANSEPSHVQRVGAKLLSTTAALRSA